MTNPFVKLYDGVSNMFAPKITMNDRPSTSSSKANLLLEAQTMQAKSLEEWKTAIMLATDPENPDRNELQKLFDNLLLDNHLSSTIDSRILFCQRSQFKLVNDTGEENTEFSWLFERTWFEDLVRYILMSRYYGNTLIEMFDVDPLTKELAQVDIIPLGYYNTAKKIILRTPGDANGWPYNDTEYANYYFQVGKDRELGMLAQLAPIVLAKKLGLGSWLDYVEKYGVPSLFITTDREDDSRLLQLYQAAENFKSNGFMVGRGQEKFEVGKDTGGGNADNFDKLIERANSEISKRILGGAGLTDEKSFVGSSEIQFRLAKDRFESDKLLVKNVINQQVIPRLIKLSPVYSVLQNHYFEWDIAESLTPEQITNMINTLSANFELDIDEIAEKTGFKILGQKSNGFIPLEDEETKKKSLKSK